MVRQIYIVNAYVVDANGTFNPLSGYPKTFDSRNYSDDVDKTLKRAMGDFSEVYGAMCKRDDRQLQTVELLSAYGDQIDVKHLGAIADVEETQ